MIAMTAATNRITPTAIQVMATAALSTVNSLIFSATSSRPSAIRTGIDWFCSGIVKSSLVVQRSGDSTLRRVSDEFAGLKIKAEPVLHA